MGLVQKVGDFLGIKKFADAMASTGRVLGGEVNSDRQVQAQADTDLQKLTYVMKNEKDPAKKAQLGQLIQSHLNAKGATESQIDPGLNLSNKEILGSAANAGLNIAMPGAFKGGAGAVIAKNAALGAGFGAASGLEKNRDVKGVVGSTVGGVLIGGAIGGAGLMAKATKDFVGNKIPEWMMNKAVKPALQDLKKNVKFGSDTLGKQLLDEGVKGGPKKLLQVANDNLTKNEDKLQNILKHPDLNGVTISREQIVPYLKDLMEQKAGTPGMGGDVNKIKSILDTVPDTMSIPEANIMKRRIYNELRDVAYKLDPKLGTKAVTLKNIAKGLKTEIEKAASENVPVESGGKLVSSINQKLSIYGKLENSMVDQLAREMRNNGIGLTDAILLAGGDTTSILALLRHVGKGLETNVAQGLHKIDKLGTGVIGGTIKEGIRRTGFNIQ